MTGLLGLQIAPWRPSREIVAVGERLRDVVDIVWVQDQMLARNVYALLAALAHAGCGVGTNVTYATGRNPIEMASAVATISELLDDGREIHVGVGTGGALVTSLFEPEKGVTIVRESIELMRALWRGDTVDLDAFPALGARRGFRPGATAKLTFPVERRPPILVAGVKPKILGAAAELADGIILPANLPTFCGAALESGLYRTLSGLEGALALRAADAPPLRLAYGINISVSHDREAARVYARRQLSLVAGSAHLADDLAAVGLDVDSAADVRTAFAEGLGVEGAAARMSDELVDSLMIAGTPEDCVDRVRELRARAESCGFNEFYLGAPLGPDFAEAAEIVANDVIPAVWPERAPVSA
jgi:alkanesulfonate monooxygenase SsuD/methylene tetrahydromethanopterin reductase-like flavin-dependent oxidoreductase (luciferase family)